MDPELQAAVATAQREVNLAPDTEPITDDDRSSSLSELEDGEDGEDEASAQLLPQTSPMQGAEDSEAETERIESSPNKPVRRSLLGHSPSRLGQNLTADGSLDVDRFSDSVISSPISLVDEPLSDPEDDEEPTAAPSLSAKKRKRSMFDDEEFLKDDINNTRRKRTRSIGSEEKSLGSSDEEDEINERDARDATAEPYDDNHRGNADEPATNGERAEDIKPSSPQRTSRRKPSPAEAIDAPEVALGEDIEGAEEEDTGDAEEQVDDAETVAKTEEDVAKRTAAMEELMAIEQRFATLRDRLYDEKISEINHELAQLAEARPSHPECRKQVDCVRKYRDDKFAYEQKLLVYKVGALKRKSIAEKATIHSSYFQRIRDVREDYLERISEHFYRIQRDRFKSDNRIPDFAVTFPEDRAVRISRQIAYNKEVSILSGVAKYVGFPAAPDLASARDKELEDDLEKMGISQTQVPAKPTSKTHLVLPYSSTTSRPVAEEQFLEQTPWANPQHPVHRQHLMNRQVSNHSPSSEQVTPAHQQKPANNTVPVGSASTIVDDTSAQVSSINNTPPDEHAEPRNGVVSQQHFRLHSTSPFEVRPKPSNLSTKVERLSPVEAVPAPASSPLAPKALPREVLAAIPRHATTSPSLTNRFGKEAGITASPNMGMSRSKV